MLRHERLRASSGAALHDKVLCGITCSVRLNQLVYALELLQLIVDVATQRFLSADVPRRDAAKRILLSHVMRASVNQWRRH